MKITNPDSAGMSESRLARIGPLMEEIVKGDQLPGIMTLLQRRGEVVHLGKYGSMDIAMGKGMAEDAIFRIYSMTKPIVSVALMMLLEEGKLSLNDPVSKYIPAFGNTKVYASSAKLGLKLVDQELEMTVHHLLTHMSGLSYGWFFDSPVEDMYRAVMPDLFRREDTLVEVVDRLAQLPLLFQPGSQWRYSFSTDVLGLVVQIIADMPLADFLSQRIFQPLGMVDTGFHVTADKVARLAQIYGSATLYDPVAMEPKDVPLIGDVTTVTNCPSGGGGLLSTLADYLSFCNCLLAEGRYDGGRLLSRKTLSWMSANHVPGHLLPLSIGPLPLDFGFGLGFRVTNSLGEARSLSSVGEFGWAGAANTYFWVDPAEQFIGLMMTQHLPLEPYPVQERFRNLAYAAIVD